MTTKTVNGQKVNIYSTAELQKFVEYVICHGRAVTPWEQGFLKSMQTRDRFSEKESAVIERIYTEKS